MKPEFVSTRGNFYALAPKSYHLTEYDDQGRVQVKKGAKGKIKIKYEICTIIIFSGIPKAVVLTEEAFRSTLFEGTPYNVPVNSFMLNSDNRMARIQCIKRGLSDSCTKVTVSADKISCTPLMKDGKFI